MKAVLKVSLAVLLIAGVAYTAVSALKANKVADTAKAKAAIIIADRGNGGV